MTIDQWLVMQALIQGQSKMDPYDKAAWLGPVHNLHQAIAKASGNQSLAHS